MGQTPKKSKVKVQKEIVAKDPLDFLYEEIDDAEMQERRKNHHEYYQSIIKAIMADKRAQRDFMAKIKLIKDKRFLQVTGRQRDQTCSQYTLGI